jgi:type II secretory pathway pseudopilin PulG
MKAGDRLLKALVAHASLGLGVGDGRDQADDGDRYRRPREGCTRLIARLRCERGMGLVELLIALAVLQIGILGLFAMFNAGSLSILRASRASAATVVAEKQIERYRGLLYTDVGLSQAELAVAATDSLHTGDLEWGSVDSQVLPMVPPSTWCATTRPECSPIQASVTGPDGRSYRVDTYIRALGPASGRVGKRITVVVRRSDEPTRPPLARLTHHFDLATGCIPGHATTPC